MGLESRVVPLDLHFLGQGSQILTFGIENGCRFQNGRQIEVKMAKKRAEIGRLSKVTKLL
jgi:hypothetical protein